MLSLDFFLVCIVLNLFLVILWILDFKYNYIIIIIKISKFLFVSSSGSLGYFLNFIAKS